MSNFDLLPEQPSGMDNLRRFGPTALIAIIALLFIVQNTERTQFHFLWFEFDWPLWIMLLAFMTVGALVAYAITRRIKSRHARRAKRQEQADHDAEP